MEPKSKVSDRFPAGKETFSFFRQFERDMYFSLRERAYQLEDRIRFGLVALNAGTILAVIAASSEKGLGGTLGVTASEIRIPLLVLILGVVLVGAALWIQRSHELVHSADAYARVMAANSAAASLEMDQSHQNLEAHLKMVQAYHDTPLVGFQWSSTVTWLQALSMGCWVGALVLIVVGIFW